MLYETTPLLNRKQEILLRNKKNNLLKTYSANIHCQNPNLVEEKNMKSFYSYYEAILPYGNTHFHSHLSLKDISSKAEIKEWIITKIIAHVSNHDTIILPFERFGICLKINDTVAFFDNELQKKIDNYVGLDYAYITKSGYAHVFFDEEHNVYEYLSSELFYKN